MPKLCDSVLAFFLFICGAFQGLGFFLVRSAGQSMSKAFLILSAVVVGATFL